MLLIDNERRKSSVVTDRLYCIFLKPDSRFASDLVEEGMMKATSSDLRNVMVSLVKKGLSRHETADLLNLAPSTVIKVVKLHDITGSVEPLPRTPTPSRLECVKDELLEMVDEHPDATLKELIPMIWDRFKIAIKKSALAAYLNRIDRPFKKKAMSPTRLQDPMSRGGEAISGG
jgi:transposase